MTTFKSTFVCLAINAAALTVLAPGAAQGAGPTEIRSVIVSYDDLDLSKEAGVAALYRRIEAAANRVCGPKPTHDLRQFYAQRNCYENAVANAVGEVKVRQLAALHEQKMQQAAAVVRTTSR